MFLPISLLSFFLSSFLPLFLSTLLSPPYSTIPFFFLLAFFPPAFLSHHLYCLLIFTLSLSSYYLLINYPVHVHVLCIYTAYHHRFQHELKIISQQYPFEPIKYLRPSLRITFQEGIAMLRVSACVCAFVYSYVLWHCGPEWPHFLSFFLYPILSIHLLSLCRFRRCNDPD